jgi:hypothetical protein
MIKREGLSINLRDRGHTRRVFRSGPACFELNGLPVFEVWHWHRRSRRWVIMGHGLPPDLTAQGIAHFQPAGTLERNHR